MRTFSEEKTDEVLTLTRSALSDQAIALIKRGFRPQDCLVPGNRCLRNGCTWPKRFDKEGREIEPNWCARCRHPDWNKPRVYAKRPEES